MSKPKSYQKVVECEFRRFMNCLEAAQQKVLQAAHEETNDTESTKRLNHIYNVANSGIHLFFQDYIENGPEELMKLYSIEEYRESYQLGRRDANHRPKLESYISSLRAFLHKIETSYLLRSGFKVFGLEELQRRMGVVAQSILSSIKYIESVINWTEKYLSWLEFGAELVCKYENAYQDDDDDDDDSANPSDYWEDPRVKVYAVLKTTDFNSRKLVEFLSDLDEALNHAGMLFGLIHRLYESLNSGEFDKIFHALQSKKPRAIKDEEHRKYNNLRELNEYVRSRVEFSVSSDYGFVNGIERLISEARQQYIVDFVNEFTNLIAFLPEEKEQRRFVRRLERGRLWDRLIESEDEEED